MTKKTISDAIGNIDTEYIEKAADYTVTKKAHKSAWAKWAALAACLSIIIIGTFHANRNSDQIVVNQIQGMGVYDIDARLTYYDELSNTEKEGMMKQFENKIGISYQDFTGQLPDIFKIETFYSMDTPADSAKTEYSPHNYVIACRTQNGGEIKISINRNEEPLRDYFIECVYAEISSINGNTVTIYGISHAYIVYFSYEKIYYDIETKNVTLEELENLLKKILK